MTADPLSQASVESEILRLSGRLDWQVGEIGKRARAAAGAEVDHKLAFARALLEQEGGTVAEREAKALIACAETYALHKGADAVLLAAQEAGRSLRAQIDALRTLAANQRAAMTYTQGVGA